MTKQQSPDALELEQLSETYEIVGELAGRKDARQFIAKRRADDAPVLISAFLAPAGDEGNALSHLAADVNRLTGANHRTLLPIIEGRWIGTDAFAVITPRPDVPSLEEVLSRRDEDFSYTRIAIILREVNGVIEWARAQKFVHRAVALDTVFLEPGTDRVIVAFTVRPLPRTGMPGPAEDARSIAVLARAMLTRSPVAPERDEQPLGDLRPGLPLNLIAETEALLQPPRTRGEAPDVTAYISRLAMAEDLKNGEIHLAETRDAILEQQRLAKEQVETERRAHEQQIATERKEHERTIAEQLRQFANEREEFEGQLEKQRQALAKEQGALANERAAHARDCAALGKERAAHKRDCEALTRERAAHKQESAALAAQLAAHQSQAEEERKRIAAQLEAQRREMAEERKRIAAELEAHQRQTEQERKQIMAQLQAQLAAQKQQTAEERKQLAAQLQAQLEAQKRQTGEERKQLAAQLEAQKRQTVAERKRLEAELAQRQREAAEARQRAAAERSTAKNAALASLVAAMPSEPAAQTTHTPPTPPAPRTPPKPPRPPKPAGPSAWATAWQSRPHWNRSWNIPAAAIALLLLIGVATLALSARRGQLRGDEQRVEQGLPIPGLGAPSTASAASTAPNVVIVDSTAGAVVEIPDSMRATISARPRPSTPLPEPRTTADAPSTPLTPSAPVTSAQPRQDSVAVFDLMGISPIPLREGNTRLDSVARPRRDTLRRDVVPRPDSIPRPDSTGVLQR